MRNSPALQLIWIVAKQVLLQVICFIELGLTAEVAEELTFVVQGVLLPRLKLWV